MDRRLLIAVSGLAGLTALATAAMTALRPEWSAEEIARIESLSLAKLPPLRPDPSNRVADDPAAAALGRALFFDTRLSADGKVACASCHQPGHQFQDGLKVGHGVADGNRRTMPIAGTAYFPFLFWDGRKDSQWSQALGPLENPAEHGADRTMVVRLVAAAYRGEYEAIFGELSDTDGAPPHAMPSGAPEVVAAWNSMTAGEQDGINRAYANIGKAIAAFERTVTPQASRFDAYAEELATGARSDARTLTADERAGLKLFIGRGNCVTCHNGPLLSDGAFHNIGLPGESAERDRGRIATVVTVNADTFNCLGPYSDAKPSSCTELKFMQADSPDLVGAFRSPSLRGVAERAPFMHAGQFDSLAELLDHYNRAPAAGFGRSELKPLGLSDTELRNLESFLRTLTPAADQEIASRAE